MKQFFKNILICIIAFLSLFIFFNNANSYEDIYNTVKVYGRTVCPTCNILREELEEENIEYTFYHIDKERDKKHEMWQKIWYNIDPMLSEVELPVVDVNGEILINPAIFEVKKYIVSKENG